MTVSTASTTGSDRSGSNGGARRVCEDLCKDLLLAEDVRSRVLNYLTYIEGLQVNSWHVQFEAMLTFVSALSHFAFNIRGDTLGRCGLPNEFRGKWVVLVSLQRFGAKIHSCVPSHHLEACFQGQFLLNLVSLIESLVARAIYFDRSYFCSHQCWLRDLHPLFKL